MASLNCVNPHGLRSDENLHSQSAPSADGSLSVDQRWKLAHGEVVADDSKHILTVNFNNKDFVMADVRHIQLRESVKSGTKPNSVALEFFFDGEMSDLATLGGDIVSTMRGFVKEMEGRIHSCVQEYFQRVLRRRLALKLPTTPKDLGNFPDTTVTPIGDTIDDSFREAGCMLRFIAVRVTVSSECAQAIGGVVFPVMFGMALPGKPDDTPVPKWLIGLGATTVVFGIATLYAWSMILYYGNSLS